MTHLAAMPIHGKNLKKSSSPEPIDRWPWNFVCSIVYASTTKVIQIMTLGWPWLNSHQGQIWSHRHMYGKKWKLLFLAHLSRRLRGSLYYRQAPSSVRRPSVMCQSTISNDFFSETTESIVPKFHIQPPGPLGKKSCSNGLDHMTKMAAMPIYGKNLKKSSSPEPIERWLWNLVCSIVYASTTKIVQIITLGWPWPVLR